MNLTLKNKLVNIKNLLVRVNYNSQQTSQLVKFACKAISIVENYVIKIVGLKLFQNHSYCIVICYISSKSFNALLYAVLANSFNYTVFNGMHFIVLLRTILK